jgi:hypothetical protein
MHRASARVVCRSPLRRSRTRVLLADIKLIFPMHPIVRRANSCEFRSFLFKGRGLGQC